MRKFLTACCLLLTLPLALSAQTLAAPETIWFDHVTTPCTLTEPQLLALTARLHQGLRDNTPVDQLTSSVPDDHTPRIIFLSLGDDSWPARVYFGTGFSFCDALTHALTILKDNEAAKKNEIVKQANAIIEEAEKAKRQPPRDWVERRQTPGQWNWLKLQIVQATKPFNEFSLNKSKFRGTDLIGFAFGPSLGFAFPPDQITGRYLLTENDFVSKKQVGNIIAEAFNFDALSTWMRVVNVDQAQRICLFETDEYFTDGVTARRLFRGHTLPVIPDAARCRDAALQAARAVAERLGTRNGSLRQPFPDWQQPRHNAESIDDMAELAIALRRLAVSAHDASLEDACQHALAPIKDAFLDFGENRQQTAIVTPEPLPPNTARQPRTLATLRNNAFAILALLPSLPATSDDPKAVALIRNCRRAASFIAALHRPEGGFHNARLTTSGQFLDYHEQDRLGRISDNALAVLALSQAATAFKVPDWQALAEQTVRHLANELSSLSPDALPIDPWLMEALTCTRVLGKTHAKLMPRLGAALIASRNAKPVAPDLPGAPADSNSFTQAARIARSISRLANWLHEYNPAFEEALAAENALPTAFHLQAQLDLPTAAALPRPKFYLGFFREAPDSYTFSLAIQNAQILALTATADLLDAYHKGSFPDLTVAEKQLLQARQFINVHPGFVNADIISNTHGLSEEARSSMGELSERAQSNVTPEESGLFLPSNSNSKPASRKRK